MDSQTVAAGHVDEAEPWTTLNLYGQALADEAERRAIELLGQSARLRTDGTDESLLSALSATLADRTLIDLAYRHRVAYQSWLCAGLPAGQSPPPVRHLPDLTAAGMPALLALHRSVDLSSVSGIGAVALVTVFPEVPAEDCPVVVRWRGHHSGSWSLNLYTEPAQLGLHLHGGRTTAVWMLRPGWVDQCTDDGWRLLREIPA